MIDWKKLAAIAFLGFVGLWLVGIGRSFFLTEPDESTLSLPTLSSIQDYRSAMSAAANWNNLKEIGLKHTPLPQLLDQDVNEVRVYDKTAHLSSGSTSFPEEEQRIRAALAKHKAVVFDEKSTGVAPERRLSLGISVRPDGFDELLHELARVGQLASLNVEQQDRTIEFRRLYAQRQSLKKHQEAILKLRDAKTLSVEESLKLEQKIMEIDKEVQTLGVQLGDFLGKESAYNLFLTLQELKPGSQRDRSFTLTKRLGSGLLWAIAWWLLAALGVGLVIGTNVSIKTLRGGKA